jgi:hypothetical protein
MKTRNGFVSNSSSTSFFIAIDEKKMKKKCPKCGNQPIDIFEAIDRVSSWDDESDVEALGFDKVMANLQEDGRWFMRDDEKKELIDKFTKANKEGKNVAIIEISYHDKTLNAIYSNLREAGIIETFRSEG